MGNTIVSGFNSEVDSISNKERPCSMVKCNFQLVSTAYSFSPDTIYMSAHVSSLLVLLLSTSNYIDIFRSFSFNIFKRCFQGSNEI